MKMFRLTLILGLMIAWPIATADRDRAEAAGPRVVPVGIITGITDPMVRQVVQRRDDNIGNIFFAGTVAGNVDGFQARSLLRPGMPGLALDWTPLIDVQIVGTFFVGIFRQPAGGFYDLQIRPVYRGRAGSAATVSAVGVGEVFITAGQSLATNYGAPTGFLPDLRVSAFNDGSGRGIDPSYPGANWQWAVDPQPSIDQSQGGSVWPTMASNLARFLNVPVGLYTAGCGGTRVDEWLPGFSRPPVPGAAPVVLFDRLTNAINYFKLRSGVRAVLWQQGESDYIARTNPTAFAINLRSLIALSRIVTGVPVKWMVAQEAVSLVGDPNRRAALEQAEVSVTDGLATFLGPNIDQVTLGYRMVSNDGLFDHFTSVGLQVVGGYWGIYVVNMPGFLGAGYLPPQ